MADHLGVNDIPKAKSLENNDRSADLGVNAARTSPYICAETVPPGAAAHIRPLLDTLDARFPTDLAIRGRTRLIRQNLAREAGGDARPDTKRQTTRLLMELGDLVAERAGGQP